MLEYYRFKSAHDLFMKGLTEEARTELARLQQRYVELCQENHTLKTQVSEYEDILFLARNLVFDGSFYWLLTGSIKQGPFCPNCYNKDGALVRITDLYPHRCASCGEVYERLRPPAKNRNEQPLPRIMEQSSAVGAIRAFGGLERNLEKAAAPAPAQPNVKAKMIPLSVKRS